LKKKFRLKKNKISFKKENFRLKKFFKKLSHAICMQIFKLLIS